MLQQYLPFTVLKRIKVFVLSLRTNKVATVLTVYGIETWKASVDQRMGQLSVATVLTVYGIETATYTVAPPTNTLQQYLPFTVLKLIKRWNI